MPVRFGYHVFILYIFPYPVHPVTVAKPVDLVHPVINIVHHVNHPVNHHVNPANLM